MPIGGSKRRALGREPEKSVGWECFSLFLSLLPALGYFDTHAQGLPIGGLALSSPPSRARAAPAAESQRAGGRAGKVQGRARKGVCARDWCAERIAVCEGASMCVLAHSAQTKRHGINRV